MIKSLLLFLVLSLQRRSEFSFHTVLIKYYGRIPLLSLPSPVTEEDKRWRYDLVTK